MGNESLPGLHGGDPKSVLLHKFSHSFNCFPVGYGLSGCKKLFMSPSLWYHFLTSNFLLLRADFPELPYGVAQKHAVKNGELKKNHQMLTCIVLCGIFNSRSLWALGQTHDQRTIISNVTSNNPHQDGPQLQLFLFNFSHPEPITKVSIDRLFLQFHWWMQPPILVAAFGRIAASKAHSLTQLHLREALERGELSLLMGSHFQKHEKLQRREWFF